MSISLIKFEETCLLLDCTLSSDWQQQAIFIFSFGFNDSDLWLAEVNSSQKEKKKTIVETLLILLDVQFYITLIYILFKFCHKNKWSIQ